MIESTNAIEFKNVSLAFDDRIVLNDVSFAVGPGEMKVVLGQSGSGKSTILKLILGLIRPDAGEILINGQEISRLKEPALNKIRRSIGMVFQEGALFSSLDTYENVAYRPREMKWNEEDIDREVRRVLNFVGLGEELEVMPDALSGGMKRRVAIARAIVDRPRIVLYDEATAGLDPPTARSVCELAIRLRDVENVSSVFVTHKVEDIRFLSSKLIGIDQPGATRLHGEDNKLCLINTKFLVLRDARIVFDGTDEQLWDSKDSFISRFLIGEEAA